MDTKLENHELQMLLNNKETGYKYRERREVDWRSNYELYRDRVQVNRITQRQSVNLPLMKTTLRTLLKDVDDMPAIVFENLDNDAESEIFQNEHWKWTLEDNNAEIQDIVDKKQDFFFGRTFDSWQIEDGKIRFDIEDPEDILVDRFMNPHDIDSSRFLIHLHIFKPLSHLKNNPDYDKKAIKDLEKFFSTKLGIIKARDNQNTLQEKNKKLSDMGVTDVDDPLLGETYVELTMHFVKRSGETYKGKVLPDQIFVYVEAEEETILIKKPQEEIIGVTKDNYWRSHYRYNSWGDDVDKQDFWSDGIADIVRVPNIILNSWFSQLVENRTLRNFGMHYYDTTNAGQGFTPSTWQPIPWGWYGVPGKPSEILQKVDIPDLSESLDEMTFLIGMSEKASGAVAVKQGAQTEHAATKFEIGALQDEATERTRGMSKFYTKVWEQRATKYLKLIEAAPEKIDAIKIYKKGKNSNKVFSREILPKNWMSESGYKVRVWSQDEKNSKDNEDLNKLNSVYLSMSDNPKLKEIYQRKLLEFANLKPEEINEVMEFEKAKLAFQPNGIMGLPPQQPIPMQQP